MRIFMAFPKADKLEHVIQKATELGASEITAFPSARCVSRPEQRAWEKKLVRWQKIAAAAAEQSGRGRIPLVTVLPTYEAALRRPLRQSYPILFTKMRKPDFIHGLGRSGRAPVCQPDDRAEGGLERRRYNRPVGRGWRFALWAAAFSDARLRRCAPSLR